MRGQVIFLGGLLAQVAAVSIARATTLADAQNSTLLHGATATEVLECSEIGTRMVRAGGNAADAMIASVLCVGVMAPWHSGQGGGGFMLVRSSNGTEVIDFRETAPGLANETMYAENITLSLVGGLAVGTYGEPAGLEALHKKYARLPWTQLFQPAIDLAMNGFRMLPEAYAIVTDPAYSFALTDPTFAAVYAPNGTVVPVNGTLYRATYGRTLMDVAANGSRAMYNGRIANASIEAIQKAGGIMTLSDLANYSVVSRTPAKLQYRDYTLYSCPAPASGAIALSAMNILSGYGVSIPASINGSTHLVVEAMKFAYGQRTSLGDPAFVANVSLLEAAYLTPRVANQIRSKLDISKTQPAASYDPGRFEILDDHGTSEMVSATSDGLQISLTTTVNTYFGSGIMVPSTGVILNNEMNDFSSPGTSNTFGYVPTEANFIRPFKRPLSSISPTIVEKNGTFYFVTGAAGGSRITSATIQVLWHVLDQNATALEALAAPRLHDQIQPNQTTFEYAYDNQTVSYMQSLGHNATFVAPGVSIAMAIRMSEDGTYEAASDPRRVSSGGSVV